MSNKVKMGVKSPYKLKYATRGSAGLDICAYIEQPIIVEPHKVVLIPTGVYLDIPEGFEVELRSRSSYPLKKQLIVGNGVGTIDSDYKLEVKVILINTSDVAQTVEPMDKIAQLVLKPVYHIDNENVEIVDEDRTGGFGSTGK